MIACPIGPNMGIGPRPGIASDQTAIIVAQVMGVANYLGRVRGNGLGWLVWVFDHESELFTRK